MRWENMNLAGTFLWLEVEWLVFLGTLISNAVFIALRSFVRHKIQLDHIPEKKQLPNIDTILAIVEVANSFNAQIIPSFVSINLFLEHNETGRGDSPLFW